MALAKLRGVDAEEKYEEITQAQSTQNQPARDAHQGTVHNDLWNREQAPDGRWYFYNRATGVSQWHVPNDLYISRVWQDRNHLRENLREDFIVRMPSSARAVLNVDCMAVSKGMGVPANILDMQDNLMRLLSGSKIAPDNARKPILPRALLELTIARAEDLRDADFMPGRDKSDPYCEVNIVGKESSSNFRTVTVMDNLDPVWNYSKLVDDYETGDIISVAIYDEDDVTMCVTTTQHLSPEGVSVYKDFEMNQDECLGKILLTTEDLEQAMKGETKFRLEDEENTETEPFIYIQAKLMNGWAELKGHPAPDVKDEIEFAMGPGIDVELVEEPHMGSKIAAYDVNHEKGGYMGTFIGVYAADAKRLRRGDTIVCGRHRHTVKKIDKKGGNTKKPPLKLVVYVHFEEDIDGVIRIGETWKKVTRTPDPGYFENRVLIFFDKADGLVTRVPHVG